MKSKIRKTMIVFSEPVESSILLIHGCRVIPDSDLAKIYGVPTKRLNEAVKRNREKFPSDFAFQLSAKKFAALRSQIATTSYSGALAGLRKHRAPVYRPFVFTEYGAIMAANVLNSPRAVQMSVFVVRAFVKMREALGGNRHLAAKLAELEQRLTGRLDVHEKAIVHILDEIKKLMEPLPPEPEPERREIGFHVGPEIRPNASARKSLAKVQPKPI
jgi:hypothetical protein